MCTHIFDPFFFQSNPMSMEVVIESWSCKEREEKTVYFYGNKIWSCITNEIWSVPNEHNYNCVTLYWWIHFIIKFIMKNNYYKVISFYVWFNFLILKGFTLQKPWYFQKLTSRSGHRCVCDRTCCCCFRCCYWFKDIVLKVRHCNLNKFHMAPVIWLSGSIEKCLGTRQLYSLKASQLEAFCHRP